MHIQFKKIDIETIIPYNDSLGIEGFSRNYWQSELKMLGSNVKFSSEHWLRVRTNNVIERVNRKLKRHTRVIGTFPDGECLYVQDYVI